MKVSKVQRQIQILHKRNGQYIFSIYFLGNKFTEVLYLEMVFNQTFCSYK